MKTTTVENVAEDVTGFIEAAQKDRIVVTRNGKPVVLVVGLENYDDEDWGYMTSRAFWEMIRERRTGPTIPLEKVRAELLAEWRRRRQTDPPRGVGCRVRRLAPRARPG